MFKAKRNAWILLGLSLLLALSACKQAELEPRTELPSAVQATTTRATEWEVAVPLGDDGTQDTSVAKQVLRAADFARTYPQAERLSLTLLAAAEDGALFKIDEKTASTVLTLGVYLWQGASGHLETIADLTGAQLFVDNGVAGDGVCYLACQSELGSPSLRIEAYQRGPEGAFQHRATLAERELRDSRELPRLCLIQGQLYAWSDRIEANGETFYELLAWNPETGQWQQLLLEGGTLVPAQNHLRQGGEALNFIALDRAQILNYYRVSPSAGAHLKRQIPAAGFVSLLPLHGGIYLFRNDGGDEGLGGNRASYWAGETEVPLAWPAEVQLNYSFGLPDERALLIGKDLLGQSRYLLLEKNADLIETETMGLQLDVFAAVEAAQQTELYAQDKLARDLYYFRLEN